MKTSQQNYYEKHRANQWWIWTLITGINFLMIGLAVYDYYFDGAKQITSLFELMIPVAIAVMVTLLFVMIKLELKIDAEGIKVRLFPIHFSFRTFSWGEIENIYVRQYKPISEYGGWGIKGFRNNRAINLTGNMGLQLELKSGRKILIGTINPEKLSQFIEENKALFIREKTRSNSF